MNDDQTVTERALKSIIEASPLAIFDLDPRGKVNSIWNQAAEEIFGWTREEVLGQKLPIVPGEKQDEFDQLRERVLAGDSFTSFEARRQRKDGSFLTASISTAPLYDERGKVIGVMAIVDDVTGQERLERSLKKSEKKFREIFNNVNDAIYLHELTEEGLPGPFIEVNDVASEMLGYSKEEFLSMSPQNIDSGEKSSELPKIMEDLLSKGQKTFDMTHQAKDGTEIPVEVSSHLFELDEEPRVLSIARDITGRKRAQRKLQQQRDRLERAMEAGNLAWWTMELPSGKVNFNERKATMLGWKPKQFNHYTDFTELIHSEDHEKAMKVMKDHLEGKKERYEVEYRIRKKDGGYKWFRDVGKISSCGEGFQEQTVTGIVIDIDQRKKAERALEKERTKLRHLHDAVDVFQQCQTEKDLCRAATKATQEVLGFEICRFYCVEGNKLVPVASAGKTELPDLPSYRLGQGLAGKTYQTGETVMGDDLRQEDGAIPIGGHMKGYMSVPIGEVGVFQAASPEKGAFDPLDVELAEILASHLNEEIQRIRLEEELREQAIKDPLTGLYNRRYFHETLKKETEKAYRYSRPIAFLVIDVNRFKQINDRYSHQTGDQVLKEIADLLQENVREADSVIRYGGDEFLVMMPETNGNSQHTVERLKEEIDRWNEEQELLDFNLSLAIGLSHWSPDQGRNVEKALKEADRKMYEHKKSLKR